MQMSKIQHAEKLETILAHLIEHDLELIYTDGLTKEEEGCGILAGLWLHQKFP